ncbi:MAG: hypothetical protein M3Z14_07940 [Candidatus Eremiobacteraeota bacterium]|nr:hypothetical protein [Candidatus Eremiobacteraeota bacterium]
MLITAGMLRPLSLDPTEVKALCGTARIRVPLSIAGFTWVVAFDDSQAANAFRSRYRQLLAKETNGHTDAFALRESSHGMIFGSVARAVFHWPHGRLSTRAFVFLTDAVTISSFFFTTPHVISLHAAAVGASGNVAAIVGDSNAGKTTTAIACARRGLQLYTDERCVVLGDDRVMPFPRAVNIRKGGLALLTGDAARVTDDLAERLRRKRRGSWENADYRRLLGSWHPPLAGRLRSLFLLARNGRGPCIEPIPATAAVRGTLQWAQCSANGIERFGRLLRLFSNVDCYRLNLGSPDETARLIEQTILGDAVNGSGGTDS